MTVSQATGSSTRLLLGSVRLTAPTLVLDRVLGLLGELDDVALLEEDLLQRDAPLLLAPRQELEIHREVEELLTLGGSMILRASSLVSIDIRCSYQPIASASSCSDAIMRAKVRVSALSSSGGSWYWSVGMLER